MYLLFGQPTHAESSTETGDSALEAARQWSNPAWAFDDEAILPQKVTITGAEARLKTVGQTALAQHAEPPSTSDVSVVEPLVLRLSLMRTISLTLVASTLALGAVVLPWFLDGPVLLSLLPAAAAFYLFLLAFRSRLVLDETGFTVQGAIRRRTVQWRDVQSFGTELQGRALTRVITVQYRPEFYAPFASGGALGFLRLMWIQSSTRVPPFGTDIDAQRATMEAWRRAYGLPASSEQPA